MRKTMSSLLIYLLVFFSANVSANTIDSPKSKPSYGRKILVSNYNNASMQNYSWNALK